MRLNVSWAAGVWSVVGETVDAPPEPIAPHIERSLQRRLAPGAQIAQTLSRISRRGHPYWVMVSTSAEGPTVHAMLLFVDFVIPLTITGDVDGIIASLDEADVDFNDEVASLHELFQEIRC